MASTLVGVPPEPFPDLTSYSSCAFLSPRISFSLDFPDPDPTSLPPQCGPHENSTSLFEFRPEDPVSMLPADELFSEGKLVPLQLPRSNSASALDDLVVVPEAEEMVKEKEKENVSSAVTSEFSPKAPKCSSRWKEILGLKKAPAALQDRSGEHSKEKIGRSKGLKQFLHRRSNHVDASLNLPLLNSESDNDSSKPANVPSRPSLSSDSEKTSQQVPARPKVRVSKNPGVRSGRGQTRRAPEAAVPSRGVSVDSPRMNASGKVVFQNLGRSTSSPSSLNGNPRLRHRVIERSYSAAGVHITPVLNVPVCKSVFGFELLFLQQKSRDPGVSRSGSKTDRA